MGERTKLALLTSAYTSQYRVHAPPQSCKCKHRTARTEYIASKRNQFRLCPSIISPTLVLPNGAAAGVIEIANFGEPHAENTVHMYSPVIGARVRKRDWEKVRKVRQQESSFRSIFYTWCTS